MDHAWKAQLDPKVLKPRIPVSKTLAPAKMSEDEHREGLTPQIWVVGLIAVVVILLVLFGVAL